MQTSKQAALLCALCLLGTGTALAAPAAPAASSAAAPVTQKAPASAVTSVTAIAHNYGFGEAISQVALRYPEKIAAAQLSPSDFLVPGAAISAVYPSDKAYPAQKADKGQYVILELEHKNPQSDMPLPQRAPRKDEAGAKHPGDASSHSDRTMPDLSLSVTQLKPLTSVKGTTFAPTTAPLTATTTLEPELQGFTAGTYTDPQVGASIPYYLYLPAHYNPKKKYPLMVFIPDASTNIDNSKITLVQGNGATIWASPEEQAKHPSLVLAVQYPQRLVDSLGMMTTDDNVWTPGLTLVTDLIHHIADTYSVDPDRIYGTGQSQGGMANIAISDKYPDLFAAQFLVACQWNTQEMEALKDKKLWILVSRGDTKAFPAMNDAVSRWQKLGTQVATAPYWDSHSTQEQFSHLVGQLEHQNAPINYSVFQNGNHMYTWTIAYNIPGIRDWVYLQSRSDKPVFFQTNQLSAWQKRELAGQLLNQGISAYKEGTSQGDARALAYFQEADRLGHFKAARYLGLLYAEGRGVPQSDKKAAAFYQKAAKAGDITGTTLLGACYENGKGVPQNDAKALVLYQKAGERGDIIAAPALFAEARLYELGKGTAPDLAKAKALYEQAAKAGYQPAKDKLAQWK